MQIPFSESNIIYRKCIKYEILRKRLFNLRVTSSFYSESWHSTPWRLSSIDQSFMRLEKKCMRSIIRYSLCLSQDIHAHIPPHACARTRTTRSVISLFYCVIIDATTERGFFPQRRKVSSPRLRKKKAYVFSLRWCNLIAISISSCGEALYSTWQFPGWEKRYLTSWTTVKSSNGTSLSSRRKN